MADTGHSYLTQTEAAARLRLSPRTLERMRVTGRGPAYRHHGRRVLYTSEDLDAWSASTARTSTSQTSAA